jgi:hypothetical protein
MHQRIRLEALHQRMSNQLIPPAEFAPPSVKHLPLDKRIDLWLELVDENEALLRSGLRAKVGPTGDLAAAYRQWYAGRIADHDRMLAAFASKVSHREARDGG